MFLVHKEVVPSWYKHSEWGNNIETDRKKGELVNCDAGDSGEAPVDRMSQAIEP